jgi:hypothetical protein
VSGEETPGPERLRFKPTEFERLNPEVPQPDAAGEVPAALRAEGPPPNVHDMLRQNAEHEGRAGWYDVEATRDHKLRRRVVRYAVALLIVDIPLGWIAWGCGHSDPLPFVAALSGMAIFTGRLTWETWFLRTD